MAVLLEKSLVETRDSDPSDDCEVFRKPEITVVFTSFRSAPEALKRAGKLARRLAGRITLLVPQIVPYPLQLTQPPISIEWNERRFRFLAESSEVDATVQLYLCRNRDETLKTVLGPHSIVIVGELRRRWWFTPEKRLARNLLHAGHEVVLIETE